MISIEYDTLIFKEDKAFVAYCPELDISSCGDSVENAKEMLNKAVKLFLEEAEKMGTLKDILEESKFTQDPSGHWTPPMLIATEKVSI